MRVKYLIRHNEANNMKTAALDEFKKRIEKDQKLSKENGLDEFSLVYKDNSKWLKGTMEKYGWPTDEKFGSGSELCAWLITQHSPDLKFQEICLNAVNALPHDDGRRKHIAFLQDRILVVKGRSQIYGTQFLGDGSFPIEDLGKLDKLRLEAELEPFDKYAKLMKK